MLEEAHLGFLLLQSKHSYWGDDDDCYLVLGDLKKSLEDGVSLVVGDIGIKK